MFESEATIISARKIDFTNKEGKKVEGTEITIATPLTDREIELGNKIGLNIDTAYIKGFNVFDKLYKNSKLPVDVILEYEFTSSKTAPRLFDFRFKK